MSATARIAQFAILTALLASSAHAQTAPNACGVLTASQGPYDYRTEKYWVPFIERNHFTPQVEALVKGVSGYLGGDIDFVLRYIPNHHRALVAMTRLSERTQWRKPQGATWDMDCYFDRALRFRPDDTVARLLFVSYLAKRSRRTEALAQLTRASEDAGDNGFTHYNIGLLYLELGELDHALAQAHRAQALGFERPELIERLKAAGRWREPSQEPASGPAASASMPR